MIIPTLSINGEWQGTMVITAYDGYGNYVAQYIADVVLVQDPSTFDWYAVYEIGFAGGVGYLNYEPGMYTGFQFGTPIQSQPPPQPL